MTEIALIGNPNSGKTSLFNLITGTISVLVTGRVLLSNEKVVWSKNKDLEIQDLPGIYSMSPIVLKKRWRVTIC